MVAAIPTITVTGRVGVGQADGSKLEAVALTAYMMNTCTMSTLLSRIRASKDSRTCQIDFQVGSFNSSIFVLS